MPGKTIPNSSALQSMSTQTSVQTSVQTMTGPLLRVWLCSPLNAGWDRSEISSDWQNLGFHHPPNFSVAQSEHEFLCRLLADAGAEIIFLPASGLSTLDAVYAHDASLPTDHGLILLNPAKSSRVPEVRAHADLAAELGIPILGAIQPPGFAEAGDIVWLDSRTLLVGHGFRTNRAGIDQLRGMLTPHGITVLSAPLPCGSGPSACLHLMSLMSMLGQQTNNASTILVDLPWLAVETVEMLRSRGFQLLEIDYAERDSLACNVLSLGKQRLIALQQNIRTNQRLRAAGFEVFTFPGIELGMNGSGGPTCLTRPILRGIC